MESEKEKSSDGSVCSCLKREVLGVIAGIENSEIRKKKMEFICYEASKIVPM